MGIKGINLLLKRNAPDAFFTMPMDQLSGKRIAIDGHHWMYSSMAIARKKVINRTDIAVQEPSPIEIRREWFLSAINFILSWLSCNIVPVFVFDGIHIPEKDDTKSKRKDLRSIARAKIDALYIQLRNITSERPYDLIDELRKELRNYNYISAEDFDLFKTVIKGIGIPCLQAVADGEQLCSMLCVDGKVAAVFSIDTDNMVYGCPLLVTGFSESYTYDGYGNRIQNLDCVRHDRILSGLNVSHSFFVDLCIMSGCDFNTNIPGYAAIKSFALLQKHKSIDDLPRNLNTECLKHIRCREIFRYVPHEDLIAKELPRAISQESLKIDFDLLPPENVGPLDINKQAIVTARDYLEMVGISGQIERIILSYANVTQAQDGYVVELKLAPASKYVQPDPLTIDKSTPIISTDTVPMPTIHQPTALSHVKFLTLNVLSKQ
jgi:5'-3' exonuclease